MAGEIWGSGPRTMSCTRDDEGHREYKIAWIVKTTHPLDGPAIVLETPGLPAVGSTWNFGNDVDSFAWCRPNASVKVYSEKEGDAARYWMVEQTFSTKPLLRCQNKDVLNPLLEPPKVSGSFVKYTEEATSDLYGPLLNSAFERFRGPQVEFDASRQQVKIEQNVGTQYQAITLPALLMDTVNALPMWGVLPRCIKLSGAPWERLYHSVCTVYYKRTLEFDVRFNSFDREILDEGQRALSGKWNGGKWRLVNLPGPTAAAGVPDEEVGVPIAPNRTKPGHFIALTDAKGNLTKMVLNGAGVPWDPDRDVVTTCSQCPVEAPRKWAVTGWEQNPENNLDLIYVSGCTWKGTVAVGLSEVFALTYVAASSRWELSGNLFATKWVLGRARWNCTGRNVMTLLRDVGGRPEPASIPRELILTDTFSLPGRRVVRKYRGANFFELGIPAIL